MTRRSTTRITAGLGLLLFAALALQISAHPLGNFTINRYVRLEMNSDRVRLRYVVDMAEIPTLQEITRVDLNGDGTTSEAELSAYLQTVSSAYKTNLQVTVDGARVPLELTGQKIARLAGAGGLTTLRIECDLSGIVTGDLRQVRRLRLEDLNDTDRLGWREIVVVPASGINFFDSTAYASGLTDELKAYPEERLASPLDERRAELSLTYGAIPVGSKPLQTREGKTLVASRDRFAELIAVPELTPFIALIGLLLAAGLGGLHALSPGHGKTIVGAYLVGSRGTARDAAFLGLTVTITHTAGVFALGLLTLFASQYVLPEKLFPVLSLTSGAIVLILGLGLFVKRLQAALGGFAPEHTHHHSHLQSSSETTDHTHAEVFDHDHAHGAFLHSHGGSVHSHLPPGSDGEPVTWRSLLALGISGGLLPCPSALVVLLSAISLHRIGYGLVLIVAFSLGLAGVLTAIGLAFVYAGRWMKRPTGKASWLMRVLPVFSALVIACVGGVICYEALVQSGVRFGEVGGASTTLYSTLSALAFAFVLGLKHAMEADHLAAVSTIVSERKGLLSASVVGGLWGVGHTISLLVAGLAVILFQVKIGPRMEMVLEFGVALMLIALGANAIRKLRHGGQIHLHAHRHGNRIHIHPHLHEGPPELNHSTHHGLRSGTRPLLVGMMHGLAGSAVLMLLVLSTIRSPIAGVIYIVIFGLGSIGGMMAMSILIGLPLRVTARRFAEANLMLRGAAAFASLGIGLIMIYQNGVVQGLVR